MYQQKDANSTFQMFSDLFENVLSNLAPIKIEEPMNSSNKKIDICRKFESYYQKTPTLYYLEEEVRLQYIQNNQKHHYSTIKKSK